MSSKLNTAYRKGIPDVMEIVKEFDVSKIKPDPEQPRQDWDAPENKRALEELKNSIRDIGIIEPLKVMPLRTGDFLLIDGERRLRAAKSIGLKKVPAEILRLMTPLELNLLRFTLQAQKQNWSPLDQAKLLNSLMAEVGDINELARRTGKKVSTIRMYLATYDLPKDVQTYAQQNKFKISYLTELIGVEKKITPEHKKTYDNPVMIIAKKISHGSIKSPIDLRNLGKVLRDNDPYVVERFFSDMDYSAKDAYHESGQFAEGAAAALKKESHKLVVYVKKAIEEGVHFTPASKELVSDFKEVIIHMKRFIAKVEEK